MNENILDVIVRPNHLITEALDCGTRAFLLSGVFNHENWQSRDNAVFSVQGFPRVRVCALDGGVPSALMLNTLFAD